MERPNSECRWRFNPASVFDGEELDAAWETSCDQWCIESESTPRADGFRNGFEFCPYCGAQLVIMHAPAEVAA
jgi:hypothetical protein